MSRFALSWIVGLGLLIAGSARAQDIAGNWQGTLKTGSQELRVVLKIAKTDTGILNATFFSIEQILDWGSGALADTVAVEGSRVKFSVSSMRGTYEGEIAEARNSIVGTWTQTRPLPLEFHRATPQTEWKDPSPHSTQLVTVDKDVKLEVVDWGGKGRPVVFLAGLGNTAHVFDKFAPLFVAKHHVYGITRRGFGASSVPSSGYGADHLGDDVLAVLSTLKLSGTVLAAHSIGGQELSSVGSRHPERVAGLVYLDAGYPYAFYDRARGDLDVDLSDLQRKLEQLQSGSGDPRTLMQELLGTTLPGFERDLRERQKLLPPVSAPATPQQQTLTPMAERATLAGAQKYTDIRGPVLAIYAVPRDPAPAVRSDPAALAAFEAGNAGREAQAKAFETGVPSARVVRLAHASHFVFVSNEADVLREMNAFLDNLH